jgi:KUP system potassium uptake protein
MEPDTERRNGLAALALAALGVVYGDIGTSPLYAMKAIFGPPPSAGVPLDAAHVTGGTSVIFWALMLVVTLKYVVLILRANNRGEGGIMALTALAVHATGGKGRLRSVLLALGVFGGALFYGDSVITPAVSVLGAVEGLEVMTPALQPYVVPVSVLIIVALFLGQRVGTGKVGALFGPVIMVWFLVLAGLGAWHIAREPAILQALNPLRAAAFLVDRGWQFFAAVGAIVLAITGAEALYADMGHFGKRPIRIAWLGLVLPCLTLNYLGQGALLIRDPGTIANPFYLMFPPGWLAPGLVLATLASVIASQAVISGAYSISQQAVQLGFLPRLQVRHTSAREIGQIYMPLVNWALMVAVVLATIGFGGSAELASAYGIAVTGTMLITTLLTFFVVRHAWRYPLWLALSATGFFIAVDLLMLVACAHKFWDGGWFPIVMGAAIFLLMSTWQRGRALLLQSIRSDDPDLMPFLEGLAHSPLPRVPRTAVYAVANPDTVPQALLHNLKHNQVLHERNVILTAQFSDVPWVAANERVEVRALTPGFWQVVAHFGFKDSPDIPAALELCRNHGLAVNLFETSYFISRETVVSTKGAGMAQWRERLFAAMSRNAGNVADFFRLPNNSVVELGTRVQI